MSLINKHNSLKKTLMDLWQLQARYVKQTCTSQFASLRSLSRPPGCILTQGEELMTGWPSVLWHSVILNLILSTILSAGYILLSFKHAMVLWLVHYIRLLMALQLQYSTTVVQICSFVRITPRIHLCAIIQWEEGIKTFIYLCIINICLELYWQITIALLSVKYARVGMGQGIKINEW